MKKLSELTKEELIKIVCALRNGKAQIRSNYTRTKADLIIIKKQLHRISEDIQITSGNKRNSTIYYHKGGNKNQ